MTSGRYQSHPMVQSFPGLAAMIRPISSQSFPGPATMIRPVSSQSPPGKATR